MTGGKFYISLVRVNIYVQRLTQKMKFCMLSLVLPQSASTVVLFLYTYVEKKVPLIFYGNQIIIRS